jgi:hypothetical protein
MHIHGRCSGQRQAVVPSEYVIHPFSERLTISIAGIVGPTLLSLLPLATPLRHLLGVTSPLCYLECLHELAEGGMVGRDAGRGAWSDPLHLLQHQFECVTGRRALLDSILRSKVQVRFGQEFVLYVSKSHRCDLPAEWQHPRPN